MSRRNRHNLISFALFASLTFCIFLLAAIPQSSSDNVVVFVSPYSKGSHALEVVARADGYLMNTGSRPWIVLAKSSNPGFIRDLYQAGALFVGSGRLFSACFPNPISPAIQSGLSPSFLHNLTKGAKNA
ncbi:MAG: hypothetical protein N4A65_10900 [Cohaesibacter sp.]|jgi:hypothetical protein|nr:hypothetical protein [Cohaesibacter sp.]